MIGMRMCDHRALNGFPGIYIKIACRAVDAVTGKLQHIHITECTQKKSCRDNGRGNSNLGGYCNKDFDALTDKVLQETDPAKRDQLIKTAFEIANKDWAYIPLHQQALAWGVSKKVKLTQRADNQVLLYWATKQE